MPSTRARNAYLASAVAAAPPERLVTMLYDGLVSNIVQAEEAMERKDYYTKNQKLLKAQEIILYLRGTLKAELWSGGPALMEIYNYTYKLLVRGNLRNDACQLIEARKHIEPLQNAWHAAAEKVLAEKAVKVTGPGSAVA